MIAYIRGTLAYIEPEESMAVLETGGIGYRILMSGRDRSEEHTSELQSLV